MKDHRPEIGDYRYVPVQPDPALNEPLVRVRLLQDQASGLRARIAEEMARQSDTAQYRLDDDVHHHWDAPRITERLGLAPRDGAQGTLPVELAEHATRGLR